MGFTNSPLVSYTLISPNRHSPRKMKIDTITIHCVVGQATVERLGDVFYPVRRQASSNYGVGVDGRIGMYCEEKDRSWCTSSPENDHRAITIEVASDNFHPYAVNAKAMEGLIQLLVDICKRNNIPELSWKNDPSLIGHPDKQNMTVHRWFANTLCPGQYLMDKMSWIAQETNRRLRSGAESPIPQPQPHTTPQKSSVMVGDLVSMSPESVYYTGASIPSWVKAQKWYIKELKGDRAVLGFNEARTQDITSPVSTKYLKKSSAAASSTSQPYKVKITTPVLNIRTGAGMNYPVVGKITDGGIYTIIEEKSGWGKLKSGAGWIGLDYTQRL